MKTEADFKAEYDADCAKYWAEIKNDTPPPTAEEAFRVGYSRGVIFATLTMAQALVDDRKDSFEERANLT